MGHHITFLASTNCAITVTNNKSHRRTKQVDKGLANNGVAIIVMANINDEEVNNINGEMTDIDNKEVVDINKKEVADINNKEVFGSIDPLCSNDPHCVNCYS
jgi:hypothetical protein